MPDLQKITTEYNEANDRMLLTGTDAADNVVSLWMTQRMLLRLVPHFVKWLEKQTSQAKAASPAVEARTSNILQEFAQQSAKQTIPKQAPVRTGINLSSAALVRSIDMNQSKGIITLALKTISEDPITLNLKPHQLRQWLAILNGLWLKAEWPPSVWPEWMESGRSSTSATASMILH